MSHSPIIGRAWTPEEDAVVRAYYEDLSAAEPTLPGRTRIAVWKRARRIGLVRRRGWTPADDEQLRMLWGEGLTLAQISKEIHRTQLATYWHARQSLGLGGGAPQGHEYLTHAAKRTGYAVSQLRAILKWWRVAIHPALTPRGIGEPTHFHYVDSADVDEAVEAWHETETIQSAAKARGMCGRTLYDWLDEAGALRMHHRHKKHWRVRTEVIDRVIAARADLMALHEAAAKIGVSRQTLAVWLRQIDASPKRKRHVSLRLAMQVAQERRAKASSRAPRRAAA